MVDNSLSNLYTIRIANAIIYIYIYVNSYVCVCVCVYIYIYIYIKSHVLPKDFFDALNF